MSKETLNTIQCAEATRFEPSGVKKLALSVIDTAVRDLLYIYHTGRVYGAWSAGPKHSLSYLRESEPYRFLTHTTRIRDFWCMAAGLDAEALAEQITRYCHDALAFEQFSQSYSSESFKRGKA